MNNSDNKGMFNRKIKVIAALALFAVMLFGFAACDDDDDIDRTMAVKLAFVNSDILSEDSQNPDFHSAASYVFVDSAIEHEVFDGDEKYEEALEMLKDGEYQVYTGSLRNAATMYMAAYDIEGVYFKNGTATVDFDPEFWSSSLSGSSSEEGLLIGQIVLTLTQSFPEVKSVNFTVNRQPVDSLMGHLDTSGSFTAADFGY